MKGKKTNKKQRQSAKTENRRRKVDNPNQIKSCLLLHSRRWAKPRMQAPSNCAAQSTSKRAPMEKKERKNPQRQIKPAKKEKQIKVGNPNQTKSCLLMPGKSETPSFAAAKNRRAITRESGPRSIILKRR